MTRYRWFAPRALTLTLLALGLLLRPLSADEAKKTEKTDKLTPPAVFDKPAPETLDDLKAIQEHVKKVVEKVTPAVVGLRVGNAQGSGVIISADGNVLTAGHVSGKPDRDCEVILPDSKATKLKGKTLGQNVSKDSGLIKITQEGKYPFLEMGDSSKLKKGQWVLSLGHPGGFREGRRPVVRLGRILQADNGRIRTDCTLVGGDSGGPLFDMEGRVVGIHSSIGGEITINNHVPVNAFRDEWDRLAKGESFGARGSRSGEAYMGFSVDREAKNCKVDSVTKDSPAEKAGLKDGDIVTKFDSAAIANFEALADQMSKKKVGDEVTLEVIRGNEMLTLKVKIGKRP